MHMDMFMREAVKIVGNKIFNEQKKEADKIRHDMDKKLENAQPHRSAFDGIPKPSFFQQ